MRLLIISNYYPPLELGGWPQLTANIAERLAARGHAVNILTSRYRVEDAPVGEMNVQRALHVISPDIDHYHPQYTLLRMSWERENTRTIGQALGDFSPDYVFIHGMWNLSWRVALDAERLARHKVVYYIANTWPTDPNAHLAYWRQPAAKRGLRLAKRSLGWLAEKVFLSDIGKQQPRFERVLCVSAFIQRYLVEKVHVPLQNTRVVHNGIDPQLFHPGDRSKGNGRLRLLYAGGLWEHKGVPTAIEALGHLLRTQPAADVHLTLVGSGHPDYVNRLKQRIHQLGIDAYVSFRKRVSRTQMPALLSDYDVLVFPSTGPEALARMVQEAMACGLLVIGSDTGGTPEILQDGANGLMFPAGDAERLAEKIAVASGNPELRQRLVQAARRTVEERFTIMGTVDQVESYFNELLQQRHEI